MQWLAAQNYEIDYFQQLRQKVHYPLNLVFTFMLAESRLLTSDVGGTWLIHTFSVFGAFRISSRNRANVEQPRTMVRIPTKIAPQQRKPNNDIQSCVWRPVIEINRPNKAPMTAASLNLSLSLFFVLNAFFSESARMAQRPEDRIDDSTPNRATSSSPSQ